MPGGASCRWESPPAWRLRLLDLAALRALGITYSVQWLGKLEKRGEFPRRVKRTPLSQNTWREDEIERYLEALPQGPTMSPAHAAALAKAAHASRSRWKNGPTKPKGAVLPK